MQRAALPLLDYDRVQLEKISLQRAFRIKRDYVLDRLAKMGLEVKVPPKATFYVWLDLKKLEEPINNGLVSDDPLMLLTRQLCESLLTQNHRSSSRNC
jgi:aspartate/methionine/tyrosine aminotransferase